MDFFQIAEKYLLENETDIFGEHVITVKFKAQFGKHFCIKIQALS